MATISRIELRESADEEGVIGRLTRLARLELELGLAETRDTLRAALIAVALAVPSAIAAIAAIIVLIAGAFAPLFGAPWQHFIIAGGGVLLLAVAALAWSALRLRRLRWPKATLSSVEENWQWLGAQLRSRLTSR